MSLAHYSAKLQRQRKERLQFSLLTSGDCNAETSKYVYHLQWFSHVNVLVNIGQFVLLFIFHAWTKGEVILSCSYLPSKQRHCGTQKVQHVNNRFKKHKMSNEGKYCRNRVQYDVSIKSSQLDSSTAVFCAHPNSWPGEFLSEIAFGKLPLKTLLP